MALLGQLELRRKTGLGVAAWVAQALLKLELARPFQNGLGAPAKQPHTESIVFGNLRISHPNPELKAGRSLAFAELYQSIATGEATIRMGDTGWDQIHRVVDGAVEGLKLTKAEATWIRACWLATGALKERPEPENL